MAAKRGGLYSVFLTPTLFAEVSGSATGISRLRAYVLILVILLADLDFWKYIIMSCSLHQYRSQCSGD